jgi:hypothetical protein
MPVVDIEIQLSAGGSLHIKDDGNGGTQLTVTPPMVDITPDERQQVIGLLIEQQLEYEQSERVKELVANPDASPWPQTNKRQADDEGRKDPSTVPG